MPGPRGNIELAVAAAQAGDITCFRRYAGLDATAAPVNSSQEFLTFCGVLGLGFLLADGALCELLLELRGHANDPRWRTREAVAMGLQRWGDADMHALLEEMAHWAGGSLLERRAAVAALCEPRHCTRRRTPRRRSTSWAL